MVIVEGCIMVCVFFSVEGFFKFVRISVITIFVFVGGVGVGFKGFCYGLNVWGF